MYNIIQNSFTQNIIKLSARHMGNLLLLYIKVGNNGFKMTMLENLSSNKQKLTQTNAFYKTRHQSLHKNKKTQFTLMTDLLSDESLLTKQSITFSLSLSLSLSRLLLLFSNPKSTQTFNNNPMGLFSPQPTINFIISSILCCMSLSVIAPMRIPLFSWLFFIPICSIFMTFSSHVVSSHCLDNQKSLLLL